MLKILNEKSETKDEFTLAFLSLSLPHSPTFTRQFLRHDPEVLVQSPTHRNNSVSASTARTFAIVPNFWGYYVLLDATITDDVVVDVELSVSAIGTH